MKIKKGFELRQICGENIIISHGIENIDFSKVITLNESAALAWNKVIGKDFTEDDIVDIIFAEYEVEKAVALEDVKKLVACWKDAGLVED